MLNPYFQQGAPSEQNLVQDLVNEQLKMYGIEIYYLPRKYVTQTTVIREVIESEFNTALPIEAYVDSYDGYGDTPTLLSKFGVIATNEITLIISKERYSNYITPLIKNMSNIELATRPKEGDLIYFPLGDRLFEIKYVEHEKPFYQLQKNYVYELRCELFRYEDEVIDTDVAGIDDIVTEEGGVGYTQTLQMIGAGVTATALTNLFPNGVRLIAIGDRGDGYTSAPKIGFSSAPTAAGTAIGIGTLITSIVDCQGQLSGKVQGVELTNSGYGYTMPPSVSFTHSVGVGAAGTTTLGENLNVGIVTITTTGGKTGGSGYITAPTVTFDTPTHVGAAATVVVSGGSVIAAPLATGAAAYLFPGGTTGGVYYKAAPSVTFSAPGSGTTAVGVATIRYNSIKSNGVIGIGSTVITGVTTTGILVGDRFRLTYDWNLSSNFISSDTYVSAIAANQVTISSVPTNVSVATTNLEFGIDRCGIVTGITITNPGSGYTDIGANYTVSIGNSAADKNYVEEVVGVHTATGNAYISSAGIVTTITITDAGSKYVIGENSAAPGMTLSSPYMEGQGNFIFNEVVTGSATTTTARVKSWDAVDSVLQVSIVGGTFEVGETLSGSESGASYKLRSINTDDIEDKFADNDEIEVAADGIIDFSQTNPFGMP